MAKARRIQTGRPCVGPGKGGACTHWQWRRSRSAQALGCRQRRPAISKLVKERGEGAHTSCAAAGSLVTSQGGPACVHARLAHLSPQLLGALRGAREEAGRAVIGRVVLCTAGVKGQGERRVNTRQPRGYEAMGTCYIQRGCDARTPHHPVRSERAQLAPRWQATTAAAWVASQCCCSASPCT